MGWKGFVRSMDAANRRAARQADVRRRDLLRQQRASEQYDELQRAAYAADCYANFIDVLTSLHRDCGEAVNGTSCPGTSSGAALVDPGRLRHRLDVVRREPLHVGADHVALAVIPVRHLDRAAEAVAGGAAGVGAEEVAVPRDFRAVAAGGAGSSGLGRRVLGAGGEREQQHEK